MTTERLDIVIEDSQLKTLIGLLTRTADGFDSIRDSAAKAKPSLDSTTIAAREAARAQEKLGKESERTSTILKDESAGRTFRSNMMSMTTSLGTFAIGALAAYATLETLKKGFEIGASAVRAYAATNQQASTTVTLMGNQLQTLNAVLGRSIVESDLFKRSQELLTVAVQNSDIFATTFEETLSALSVVTSTAITGIGGLSGVLVDSSIPMDDATRDAINLRNAVASIGIVAVDTAILVQRGAERISNSLSTALNPLRGGVLQYAFNYFTGQIEEETSDAVDSLLESRNALVSAMNAPLGSGGTGGGLTTVPGLLDRIITGFYSIEDTAPRALGAVRSNSTEAAKAMSYLSKETQNEIRALQELNRIEKERIENLRNLPPIPMSFSDAEGMDLREETAATRERIQAQIAADKAKADERIRLLEEEAQKQFKQDMITTGVNAGFSFGDAAITRLMEGGANVGLDIGDALSSNIFSTLGQTLPQILSIGGPWGAAISGGIGLIGSVVSGLFGRERRRREREARAQSPVQQNTSTTVILTNNFGLFTDRRSTAAAVSQATTQAIRRGA
jgi:hypothetical protein